MLFSLYAFIAHGVSWSPRYMQSMILPSTISSISCQLLTLAQISFNFPKSSPGHLYGIQLLVNKLTNKFIYESTGYTSVISSLCAAKFTGRGRKNSRSRGWCSWWDFWKSAYGGGDWVRLRSEWSYLRVESPLAILVPIPLSEENKHTQNISINTL